MQKVIKYAIFKTKWGYFGLAGTEKGLLRTHLPLPDAEKVKYQLLRNSSLVNGESSIEHRVSRIEFDRTLFNTLQKQIIAYFEGTYVNFDPNIPIVLDGFSTFARRVLTACRNIGFGQTISYGQLAQKIRRPAAARAVGRVMANNPLPLIIPCHRVIRSDGRIGGFSAQGGTKLKNRLLQFELKVLHSKKCHCEHRKAMRGNLKNV